MERSARPPRSHRPPAARAAARPGPALELGAQPVPPAPQIGVGDSAALAVAAAKSAPMPELLRAGRIRGRGSADRLASNVLSAA
mmetsp:Transcript_12065/g.39624  ORF Transcript_12065/g.39624 Transcript_12065/m.39624 type:complete len:84 (+) Transcript_12065:92-343(+)|eukprot:scaffold4081_cov119-Isochrysis_galbana.AAC.2